MAFLLNLDTQQRCFLHAHHSFGRLGDVVDTVINLPAVSKHHAIIEWQDEGWMIRDLSLNGCWVNRTKLAVNHQQPLKVGDLLHFANPQQPVFEVIDLSPPCDLLIPLNNNTQAPVRLGCYHLLPDETNPQVVLFMDQNKGQWSFSRVDHLAHKPQFLSENDVIEFNNQVWQLKLGRLVLDTEMVQTAKGSFDDLNFIFNLSGFNSPQFTAKLTLLLG
jgi:hypothetical protein